MNAVKQDIINTLEYLLVPFTFFLTLLADVFFLNFLILFPLWMAIYGFIGLKSKKIRIIPPLFLLKCEGEAAIRHSKWNIYLGIILEMIFLIWVFHGYFWKII